MRYKLAVLDMAGTTVHDGDAVHTCLHDAMEYIAGVEMTREACNSVMGIPKPVAVATLLREAGAEADAPLVGRIIADFEARMLAYYRSDPAVREIDGAAETFKTLRQMGLKVALDTGFSRKIVDAVIDRLGWGAGGLIDVTIASDEVSAGRPAPYLIFHAMERTGVTDVAAVVKVGDTPSDLREGKHAGVGLVVGVTRGSHTADELRAHPHDALIDTVRDLPELLSRDESARSTNRPARFAMTSR